MRRIAASYFAVVLLAGLALSSCAPKDEPVADAPPSEPLPGSTSCEFDNALGRLGLFDPNAGPHGSPAKPVKPASIGNGHIYVLTHGWAPDYRPAVENYCKQTGKVLLAWDPAAVANGVRYFTPTFVPLAKSILKADPKATVLFFSWIDHSATNNILEAYQSEAWTVPMGHTMTLALAFSFNIRATDRKLHFMGHSHGTKVATVSAIRILPRQLTLFDSPENDETWFIDASNQLYLPPYLPSYQPNRTDRFVDNYISFFDICYHSYSGLGQVVDVPLVAWPCKEDSIETCMGCAHEYGLRFYALADDTPGSGLGLAWSPLLGSVAPTLDPVNEQTWQSAQGNPLVLKGRQDCPYLFDFLVSCVFDEESEPPAPIPMVIESRTLAVTAEGDADARAITTASLASSGTALWKGRFETSEGDLALGFTYRFTEPGDGDLVVLTIDGKLRRVLIGEAAGGESDVTTASLEGLAPGEHEMVLTLEDKGPAPVALEVGSFEVYSGG